MSRRPQLLQSLVNFPVIAPPRETLFYNNAVYAVGTYLSFLTTGVGAADLAPAYGQAMRGPGVPASGDDRDAGGLRPARAGR